MTKKIKSFEEISKKNKSNYTIEKGANKMIIKNFEFEKKNYYPPYNCPSIDYECRDLIERILYREGTCISDAIGEISGEAVHIYNADLMETFNFAFSHYVEDAIAEFGLNQENRDGFEYILECIRYGEFLYFQEQLNEHIETIVQNALISYLKDIQIVSEKDYNPDDINNFIESYIDDVNVDTNDTLDSIIEDFETELKENFDVEIEPKTEHNKKSA